MATNFPTSVDAFTNPTANDSLNTPSHSTQHADINDAVEAVEGYLISPSGAAPKGVVRYTINTAATLTLTTTTETSLFTASSFTPIAGRLYELTYVIGSLTKTTGAGNINVRLRKDSTAGAVISSGLIAAPTVSIGASFSKTIVGELGSTAFVPTVTVQATTNGLTAANTTFEGCIIIKDIGLA